MRSGMVLLEFRKSLFRKMEVLGVTRLQSWTTHVMDVDEDKNAAIREVEPSPRFTTVRDLSHQGAVKFSESARLAPNKSKKR